MKPTLDVWQSMGLDKHLRPKTIKMRNELQAMMTEIYDDLTPYINSESMPMFVIPKI